MHLFVFTSQDLKLVNSYLKSCFLIFPNYNLGHGLMEMAYNEYINEYYAKIGVFMHSSSQGISWGLFFALFRWLNAFSSLQVSLIRWSLHLNGTLWLGDWWQWPLRVSSAFSLQFCASTTSSGKPSECDFVYSMCAFDSLKWKCSKGHCFIIIEGECMSTVSQLRTMMLMWPVRDAECWGEMLTMTCWRSTT